jgi:hypothetical protein
MSKDPLEGVKAKIARAGENLQELDEQWQAFGKTQSYAARHEFKPDICEWNSYLSLAQPIPIKLSMILGEGLNNMRSSLDHLVCRFVELYGGKVSRSHAFLICGDVASFKKQEWRLAGIPADAPVRGLIEEVQPYHMGDRATEHPLSVLNKLSNTDKHHDHHRPEGYPDVPSALDLLTWIPDDAELLDHTQIWQPGQTVGDRTHIARLRFSPAHPATEVNVRATFPLGLAFDDFEPGPHLESVADILAYVGGIVRRGEGLYATTIVT